MNYYLDVLKKYAVFQGRARRKEYWFFVLFNTIFCIFLSIIDAVLGTIDHQSGLGLLSGLYSLAMIIPGLAAAVRRLHDTNRSGWMILIVLIPFIGAIWLLILLVLDSSPEENRFGANPKVSQLKSGLPV